MYGFEKRINEEWFQAMDASTKLYYGSNVEVKFPIIKKKLRALDFGAGFYLTSSRQQAERWAKTVTKRRRVGVATVNIYELDERQLDLIEVLRFETANAEWLEFVVANRKEQFWENIYDVVIGPVANGGETIVASEFNRPICFFVQ